MSNEDTSYRVGRGRPPRHSQFQKGRSGNPKGRPKAMKSADTILREQLAKKISIGTGASRRRVTTLKRWSCSWSVVASRATGNPLN